MTTDTIPEDTCCGQKLKQKDTWLQPKVTLKGHRPETEDLNEPAYYPATVSTKFREKIAVFSSARLNQRIFKKNSKPTFFFQFFRFSQHARGTPKIFDVQFSEIFKIKFQKWLLWDMSGIERNKVKNFGEPSHNLVETTDCFRS